jgi:hypothetical protein
MYPCVNEQVQKEGTFAAAAGSDRGTTNDPARPAASLAAGVGAAAVAAVEQKVDIA